MDQRRIIELGVLGLLAERESTIDTLQERFNHNFGRHQFAGYGTLEPTIRRLLDEGYVTGTHSYAATERGRERLRELLSERVQAVDDPSHRPHLLVKLGFLHHLPPERQDEELADLEDRFHRAREKWLDAAAVHDDVDMEGTGYRRALIDLTIELLDAQLEWIRGLRRSLAPEAGTDGRV
jgi:DNA-binding PadR family transcriptional regulator